MLCRWSDDYTKSDVKRKNLYEVTKFFSSFVAKSRCIKKISPEIISSIAHAPASILLQNHGVFQILPFTYRYLALL